MHHLASYIYSVAFLATTYRLPHNILWNIHVYMDITYILAHKTHTQTSSNYSDKDWGKEKRSPEISK